MTKSYQQIADSQSDMQNLTVLEKRFHKLPRMIQRFADGAGHYLSQVGVVLVGVVGLMAVPWNIYLGISGAIIVLIASYLVRRRQKLLTDIERDLEAARGQCGQLEADIEQARTSRKSDLEVLHEILAEAAKDISQTLELWDNHTRLSLYCHSDNSEEFIRLARVSDNPSLETTGRKTYPDNEGFIASVWQGKPSFVLEMPKTRKRWEQYQTSQFNLDPETVPNLTMHTKCMIGARVDYNSEPIGVVVIESVAEGRLSSDDADNLKSSRILIETISRLLVASKVGLSEYLPVGDRG